MKIGFGKVAEPDFLPIASLSMPEQEDPPPFRPHHTTDTSRRSPGTSWNGAAP